MAHARVAAFVAVEIASVIVQASQGASLERQLGIAISVAALLGSAWAVATFVLKPLVDRWLKSRIEADTRWFDGIVFDTLDRNDKNRDIERRRIERLFHDRMASSKELSDRVEANRDRLVFIEESNARQGEAITKELARAMDHMARSTDAQTRIMEKIQKELESHSIIIARLDERIQQWDGHERRQRPRGHHDDT